VSGLVPTDVEAAGRPANAVLASFFSGAVRVMVATDIAARGIHVDGIDLIIHADPPAEYKAYVHRAGRAPMAW
jgi:superfamily II DNA/RNA helicase